MGTRMRWLRKMEKKKGRKLAENGKIGVGRRGGGRMVFGKTGRGEERKG